MAHQSTSNSNLLLNTYPTAINKFGITQHPRLSYMGNTHSNALGRYNFGAANSMMDWEPDEHTIGFTYSYSPIFPVSISMHKTEDYLLWGDELGFNFNKKRYLVKDDPKDPIDPIMYYSLYLGAYFKYISISCGLGVSLSKNHSKYGTEISNDGVVTIVAQNKYRFHFFAKPTITGYIPIDSWNFLTLNVGYTFFPYIKAISGFTFGAGWQFEI